MGIKKGAAQQARSKVAVRQQTLFDLFPKQTASTSSIFDGEPEVEPEEIQISSRFVKSTMAPPVAVSQEGTISTRAVVQKLRMASLEPRPKHAFFTKRVDLATLNSEKLATSDDDSIVEVSAASLNPAPEETENLPLSRDGGSQDDPIIVDSSPVKCRPPIRQIADPIPLASIFAPRPKKDTFTILTKKPLISKTVDAPYPDGDLQHVRGPQHTFTPPDLIYPRRPRPCPVDSVNSLDVHDELPSNLNTVPFAIMASSRLPNNLEATLKEDQFHPRFRAEHPEATLHNLWVDKWHPRCAEEVLGNESNAVYLRDWLRALELQLSTESLPGCNKDAASRSAKTTEINQGRKRPRVVRTVERTRSRKKRRTDFDDESDWIVYSDDSEEEILRVDDSETDGEFVRPPISRLRRRNSDEYLPPPEKPFLEHGDLLGNTLTNTILLTGPPGTGKTAAVYACAEELGWEVFEVYPGIGKRNGAGIESLVGDVGKNHHVKSGAANLKARNPFATLVGDKAAKAMQDPPCMDADTTSSVEAVSSGVRQSVVLLEEVDILFREDANFWPAVINLIKDCKRPVICTCNDISLIPTLDLPLQAILDFKPCPESLAAAYLQSLCAAEGYSVQRQFALQLYTSNPRLNWGKLSEIPLPSASGNFRIPDLRQTINYLQFQCTSTDSKIQHTDNWQSPVGPGDDLCDWRHWHIMPNDSSIEEGPSTALQDDIALLSTHGSVGVYAELLSFLDGYLVRSPWDMLSLRSSSGLGCEQL